ncbi:MAG TPA: cytochrome c oxidase assembly protein [Ktedonobacteraceae bacterium]
MFYGLNLTWHWSPITLACLIAACLLYIFAIRRARRDNPEEKPLQTRRVVAFFVAIAIIALLLLTPIDMIARTQLFLAHMTQSVTLITVCAPLLLYACPAWLVQPLFTNPFARPIARALTQPVIASMLFNLTFLLWHAPLFFNFALKNGTFYHVMLGSFLLTSLLNWWPLIGPVRDLHEMTYPQQMLYAFLDGQPVDIFAFLLVFSFVVFYPHYAVPPQLGISAFADQAAGGALLLLPGLVDLGVMSPLFFRWLGQLEAKAKIADQQREEEEAIMEEEEGMEQNMQA